MNISPSTSDGPDVLARNGGQALPASQQPALAPDIQVQIGRRLVAAYDHVLHQPVPDRFRLLLDELDRKSQDESDALPDAGPGNKGDST